MKTHTLELANAADTGAAAPVSGGNTMINTAPQTGNAPVNDLPMDPAAPMNAVVATR